MSSAIIAVDFDGTCVEHEYPRIGADVPGAVEVLKWIVEHDAKIILWTMRSDPENMAALAPLVARARETGESQSHELHLTQACRWFDARGIPLWGVNRNPAQGSWSSSPKAYAQVYIDDAALGCPLMTPRCPGGRPTVNWPAVKAMLQERYGWAE